MYREARAGRGFQMFLREGPATLWRQTLLLMGPMPSHLHSLPTVTLPLGLPYQLVSSRARLARLCPPPG